MPDSLHAVSLPPIAFTYETYEAKSLGLQFEAPSGWIPDESIAGVYTLTNPDPSMDYAAKVEIRATPVNTNYNAKELTKEVKAALDSIRSEWKFKTFEGSDTASRFFIDGNGVYASFRGNLDNLDHYYRQQVFKAYCRSAKQHEAAYSLGCEWGRL